tara:strand:- start:15694 stop:16590 length:897 start_codon:yes stop_codon:yes gene_type:complete
MLKILLTGAYGQLGQSLRDSIPNEIDLISFSKQDLDLSDIRACEHIVMKHKPDWVINTGAYTAVDLAEINRSKAFAINAKAPEMLSKFLKKIGGKLLQISTDFVFDGNQSIPYKPLNKLNPLNVYGASKAEGEFQALKNLNTKIIRTSWLYGVTGKNFCLTMINLHRSKSLLNEEINVVSDQIGSPTSTVSLAKACWKIIQLERASPSIMHWSDCGCSSWYDFAIAIGELSESIGLIKKAAKVNPIKSSEFIAKATRPSYSILDCTETWDILNYKPNHWHKELRNILQLIYKGKQSLD